MNFVFQAHPPFHAAYSGDNSLSANYEKATSRVLTLFTGVQVNQNTDLLFDIESSGGRGISNALGLAGFTNLDVVRNPALGSVPYLARAMVHRIIALGSERAEESRNALSLTTAVPLRRLEFRAGKLSTVDFFDANAVGSDSHLQFLNWTVDNNGAYDYAADTRGYTWGAIIEYHSPAWVARFGEMLMPKVANGMTLDWNVCRAGAENAELEFHPKVMGKQGTVRLLSYLNRANMGDYREAVQRFEAGGDARPIIENTRRQGRIKYGFGLNGEQPITASLRVFARWGWNEGRHESFAYTEVNDTAAVGADHSGTPWRRKQDKLGIAVVTNGISKDHQAYLRLGGRGFVLGDGSLSYGREGILETYYTAHLWRGVFASADLQYIRNPGYNNERGPVLVPGSRLHVDF
ncbi:MAG: carbohydrate porin [Terriglobales bacterium]